MSKNVARGGASGSGGGPPAGMRPGAKKPVTATAPTLAAAVAPAPADAEPDAAGARIERTYADFHLPVRVIGKTEGPQLVRYRIEPGPGVKVVFMSGYAEDGLAEDQARVPNSVFLPKPFSLNDLTNTVQGLLS